MTTPVLRFNGFSTKWKSRKLSNITSDITAGNSKLTKSATNSYPIIGSTGIIGYSETFDYEGKYVLIARVGANAGKISSYEGRCNITDNTIFFETVATIEGFLLPLLEKKQINKMAFGSGQPLVKASDLKSLKVMLPSFEEQQKIADFFTLLDRRIEQQEEKVEAWREYKKGMMQKLFSRELRFKDEDGEEFPKWTLVSLGSVSEINPKTEALKDSFQYIDLESVKAGQLLSTLFVNKEDAPSRAQRVVKKGDILYQTVRPYQKNNLFYNHNIDGQVVASTGYAQIKTNDKVLNNSFLYQYLNTNLFTVNVLKKCTGTSYPAINSSDLGTIDIPLPCLKEQKYISALLSSMDNKVKVETAKLSTLRNQKNGLIQQMFI